MAIAATIHLLCLNGCSRTYVGTYLIGGVTCSERVFVSEVQKAIAPFGFRGNPELSDFVDAAEFDHRLQDTSPEFLPLDGAGARVYVIVEHDLKILVRDLDHVVETKFVKALKQSLEQRLRNTCVKTIEFRRISDFLT